MKLIAIEEHWNLPELTNALESLPPGRYDDSIILDSMGHNSERLVNLGDQRIALMDAQGVDMQILSLAPPATHPLDAEQARTLAFAANNAAAEAVRRHPLRLRALATLPLVDPESAVAELERTTRLGFVGVMTYGRTGSVPLDDPRYDDLLAAAAALEQPVFIHPQTPRRETRQAMYDGFDDMTNLALATFGWGWHIEAATAALRLIVCGAFDRHPGLQIVLGHWGELLLFWLDRTNSLSRISGLKRKVSDYIRTQVHITNSGMLNPALLRHALTVTTTDRLLFSTDYPFQNPDKTDIDQFLAEFPTSADQDKFTSKNARALFKI